MSHFVHEPHPVRHKPTVTTGQIGARVTCLCGWSATAPNPWTASTLYQDHETHAKSGGES